MTISKQRQPLPSNQPWVPFHTVWEAHWATTCICCLNCPRAIRTYLCQWYSQSTLTATLRCWVWLLHQELIKESLQVSWTKELNQFSSRILPARFTSIRQLRPGKRSYTMHRISQLIVPQMAMSYLQETLTLSPMTSSLSQVSQPHVNINSYSQYSTWIANTSTPQWSSMDPYKY